MDCRLQIICTRGTRSGTSPSAGPWVVGLSAAPQAQGLVSTPRSAPGAPDALPDDVGDKVVTPDGFPYLVNRPSLRCEIPPFIPAGGVSIVEGRSGSHVFEHLGNADPACA